MNRIYQFIIHQIIAKTRHGVHSPFVYSLIDECIYGKLNAPKEVFLYYSDLKSCHDGLSGVDFGRQGKLVERSVSELVKTSSSRNFEAGLLNRIVQYQRPENVLELGSNLGKSASAMAFANPHTFIHGIDGNEAFVQFSNKCFNNLGLKNARCAHMKFNTFFADNTQEFDMVFIDGDHHYDSTLTNYNASKNVLKGEGPIVLHDIYWSGGMRKAWGEIKSDPDATVTIDLFFFGIVYFRTGQRKEHFNIRFPQNLLHIFF